MLEELIEAVEYARISRLLRELSERREWQFQRRHRQRKQPLAELLGLDTVGEAAIVPVGNEPVAIAHDMDPRAEQVVVAYASPGEEPVTYVLRSPNYSRRAGYGAPKTNLFYVHVPPWASIQDADELAMGAGVLGDAHLPSGRIRLLHTLDPIQRAEVLLHETLHLLYPMHSEKAIRDLVRTVIPKEYRCFH